ncbi:hypothetical protein N7492_009349 [Penicillium capsulatum]|uniref:Uncharacterized protein n=1 Tax=Penicillium capsulatum TaxID=69766 RepID=A0A9W9HV56_9EURO|nr:hypothetical protein N7492_009349 [Penicillium capsulatum]
MKFSLPFTLALATAIAPALATESVATVTIQSEKGAQNYTPIAKQCVDTKDASSKVTSITVKEVSKPPSCIFYTESGCKGNEWPIAVPADSKDGSKKTTFSKPFYVGSLKCQLAQ